MFNCSILAQTVSRRFFGLFGLFYSLEYLSLSDATVLTFLVPMCTAIIGALFLGENFLLREAFAGRKWTFITIIKGIYLLKSIIVVSLLGVVLITRPTAIFGSANHSVPVVAVTESQPPAERLIAVGYVITSISNYKLRNFLKDCLDWRFGFCRSL